MQQAMSPKNRYGQQEPLSQQMCDFPDWLNLSSDMTGGH